jgi:hypothetical protein
MVKEEEYDTSYLFKYGVSENDKSKYILDALN